MKRMYRKEVKKIYRDKRKGDRLVGQKIDNLVKTLVYQHNLPKEKRDVNLVTDCLKEMQEVRSEPRFREDFPSFSSFYHYLLSTNENIRRANLSRKPEEKEPYITLEDLRSF